MKNAVESTLSDQMRLFTVSLNGVTDKKTVNDFINHMPAADSRFLRTAYSKLSPNLDMTQDFSCYECGHEGELEVPFTAEFFYLNSDYMEKVYEMAFLMKYHGSWSFTEFYSLPVGLRKWF